MTYQNVQRDPQSAAAIQSGLRLVYSRDWPRERRMRAIAQQTLDPNQRRKSSVSRVDHIADTIILAAAALVAPFAWAAHALLKLLRIL
jgi:hypothetical protein